MKDLLFGFGGGGVASPSFYGFWIGRFSIYVHVYIIADAVAHLQQKNRDFRKVALQVGKWQSVTATRNIF